MRPERLRSLLVPLDLAAGTERVAGRVAQLPLADDARVTLLHVVPEALSRDLWVRAEEDARRALDGIAADLAAAVPAGAVVDRRTAVGVPAAAIAAEAEATGAELVVMGRGGPRALRDLFLGSTAERVVRRGQLPVLVVRLAPRAPYRRPVLALDFDRAAADVLALALRLLPPPRPPLAVAHAYDAPYQGLVYPSVPPAQAAAYRRQDRRKALHDLEGLLTRTLTRLGFDPQAEGPIVWKPHVRFGAARTVVAEVAAETGADLLVLGTRGHGGLAQAFLGTVAGDVLREVACDALVVPPLRRHAAAP